MNSTIRGTVTVAAALLMVAACDGGDEYTEDGRLVEKTDVRVKGVDFGATVDSQGRLLDETDTFAPSDTIYASVRTKGSSPKTVLGVRWTKPNGDEFVMDNKVIRPAGDTATLFALHHLVDLDPGRYSMDMRVNGKVVKTAHVTVSKTAERHVVPAGEQSGAAKGRLAAIRPYVSKTFARLTAAATNLFEREPKEQSPFEWRGLRAGMTFSRLDRVTRPASAWKCTPVLLSVVGLERGIAVESEDFSAGHVVAMVDTVGQRVVDVRYNVSWMPSDISGRVALEREMTALAAKWNAMPGVVYTPRNEHDGPSFASWRTADSVWKATIFYSQSKGTVRPDGFEIEEIQWGERAIREVPDSVKGHYRNPESPVYQKPNAACEVLLNSARGS